MDKKWETKDYDLKSGTYTFRWWYGAPGGLDDSVTNIDLIINNIDPVKIPLEVLPGSDYQFSHTKITFFKNTTIESMLSDVTDNGKQRELFFDIIRNGFLMWRGLVDFASITREDWHLNSSSFTYRKMTMKINGALWYFSYNQLPLSYGDYASGYKLDISDLLTLICDKIGLAYPSDVETYGVGDFLDESIHDISVIDINLQNDVISLIKEIMLAFGVYIFYLNGKLRIVSKGSGDHPNSISKYWQIKKESDRNEYIEYLEITCALDILNPGTDYPGKVLKISIGEETNRPGYSKIQYRLNDGFGRLGPIGTGIDEQGAGGFSGINGLLKEVVSSCNFNGCQIVTDTEVDESSVDDFAVVTINNDGLDDFTSIAAIGYTIDIYDSSSNTLAVGSIVGIVSSNELKFICLDTDLSSFDHWRIRKNSNRLGNYYRNQSIELFQHLYNRYSGYIGNPVFSFCVKGINMDCLSYIDFYGNVYRPRYFGLDIMKNKTIIKAHELN